MTTMDVSDVPVGCMFEWDGREWLRLSKFGPFGAQISNYLTEIGQPDAVPVLEVSTAKVTFFVVPEKVVLVEG